MSDWLPDLYLRFEKERTQPAIDLLSNVHIINPQRIIDIGCGPGNSTILLKNKWQNAEIIGLDNSEAMISKAKENPDNIRWIHADASKDLSKLGKFDLVFSNAAIQWIPDNHLLLPRLFELLNRDGILAVQVPFTKDMPVHTELSKLILSEKWKTFFLNLQNKHSANTAAYYYNALCQLTEKIFLWQTDYFHIMDKQEDIVEWYKSTGLKPYLDYLKSHDIREDFINDYTHALKEAYPLQSNHKVLFPFTRIFFIAQKQEYIQKKDEEMPREI